MLDIKYRIKEGLALNVILTKEYELHFITIKAFFLEKNIWKNMQLIGECTNDYVMIINVYNYIIKYTFTKKVASFISFGNDVT